MPISMMGAFPGLFLFTSPARFVRPVKQKFPPPEEKNNIELIGPFEQVRLSNLLFLFYINCSSNLC